LSHETVSKITDEVLEEVQAWQSKAAGAMRIANRFSAAPAAVNRGAPMNLIGTPPPYAQVAPRTALSMP